jgi:hypothetical protein
VDWIHLTQDRDQWRSCEHGNEFSVFTQGGGGDFLIIWLSASQEELCSVELVSYTAVRLNVRSISELSLSTTNKYLLSNPTDSFKWAFLTRVSLFSYHILYRNINMKSNLDRFSATTVQKYGAACLVRRMWFEFRKLNFFEYFSESLWFMPQTGTKWWRYGVVMKTQIQTFVASHTTNAQDTCTPTNAYYKRSSTAQE